MFPVVVRYFSKEDGIKVRIIELTSENGEKSDIIVNLLNSAIEKFNLSQKLASFCADNAPCNFGNRERTGRNNTFYKLNQLYPGLIGVGCAAHIVHNTLKAACDKMPFDVEMVVVKIYSHFYLTTVRVTALKEFCASVDVAYRKVLGYCKTRFLDLLPAVESILRIFEPLKQYFSEDRSSPNALKTFFKDPMAKIWLIFLKDQATLFNRTVKLIEGDKISGMEVGHALHLFVDSLENRKNCNFLSAAMQREIENAEAENEDVSKELVLLITTPFYETCIDYIQNWIARFRHIMIFAWAALDRTPEWEFVEVSAKFMASKQRFEIEKYDIELFDQFSYIKKFISDEKIQSWEENNVPTDQRWVECFKHFAKNNVPHTHIVKIVAYILALPGTSAPVERIFSIINDIWSTEKTRLSIQTLKDILYIRYNIKMTCLEFFEFIKTQPKLLEKIGSNEKYAFKNSKNDE